MPTTATGLVAHHSPPVHHWMPLLVPIPNSAAKL
jgi:hypothetical protein